ncbi:hypothetical protein GE21DRAFT_4101 [Neurospora crassa]|uniref:Uncharacterized protein n=1 Tax=Neurospora crassa (strain ATCC 24698 / 74-OR23-1A / CBS 708.71 / DSM 1257 / FGSC 987) TaxID=367110 RepID=Q7RYU6_NEUCR|nr:hypothetical protein NCU06474 [Neurospora crassa OR74A]EAA28129.2 hypothetical protein NCU06474 [Neurospora crassa OR74A]KHE85472.1 hypothetical protein GE21DRAFT_4101 [Neurospora crassa]|eukprot:XP_957365.2 hypothetical protein NCU06474 [Neurospora crassa OR74A]
MCLTDERKFPFFSLPAELRCMVYRAILTMTSTITRSTKEHLKNDEQPTQASQQLEPITNFNNLAWSCKQIRSELFYEHIAYVLPLTQIHLGSAYRTPTPSALALTNHAILQQLQFSAFLTQHIYHRLTSTSANGPVLSGSGPGVAEEEAEERNDSDNGSDEGYYEFAHFFCITQWYQMRRVEEEQYERTGIWERMEEEYKGGDESKHVFAEVREKWLRRNPKHNIPANLDSTLHRGLTTGLESLALTCRKVRDEVLHEYMTHILPFTQIHLGSKNRILQGLWASSLLTQHVKHVSLLWGSCVCARDGDVVQPGNYPGGLRWLLKLQQLTSLELVFTDARYNAMQRFTRSGLALPVAADEDWDEENDGDEDWDEENNGDHDEFMDWFCFDCWEQLMGLPHTLEKVIFKVWCGAGENGEAAVPVVRETWEVTKWFRRMKVLEERYQRSRNLNVEDGVKHLVVVEEEVDDVDENEEPPTYRIEHHVGDVDVEWPLSDTI